MRKNLISLFLAAALAVGSINPASVCAAEISEQEAVTAEENITQEESAEEQAETETEETEIDKHEETITDTTEEIEKDSTGESEESSAEESSEDESEEQTEDTGDIGKEQIEGSTPEKDDESLMDEIVVVEGTEEVVVPGSTGAPSSYELFASFVERSFEGQPVAKAPKKLRSAVSALQGYDRGVYNYIAAQLPQIASGVQASTVFEISPEIMGMENDAWTAEELGVDAVIARDENNKPYVPADATEAALAQLAINLSRILDVLLAEHPNELYWYDKTAGAGTRMKGFGLRAEYDRSRGAYVLRVNSNMLLRFCVAEEYSAGEYLVDTSIGRSVQRAVDNADAIVAKYSGLSDEEKLRGYKDEICRLVSYNSYATGGVSYGNPWQMIWVFDEDPGTNVVCEGYAKAFKYLCDHSAFEGDIECILAGGDLVTGSRNEPHMWNILKMDDGKNYLADVTNCDAGTAGSPDKVFLAGTTQTKTDSEGNTGYYFADSRLTYYYDSDTRGIFSEADLEVFLHGYGKHEQGEDYTIVEPTCTEDGAGSGHCVVCGEAITEIFPATGHKYGGWKVTRKATGTVTGIREKTCSVCGHKATEQIPVLSGTWKKDSTGWWYQWSDRTYPVKMFLKISGKTYYFNASGYMVTGWQYIGGKWYYFDGSGAMVTGWQYIDGKWYYMHGSGVMLTGKQYIGGKWYYFNGSGAMVTGWQYIGSKWYYFSGSGAMVTGWQYIGGKWYYMNGSGAMVTGWQYIGGKWYYMNGSGAMVTGWQYIGGKWYYMNGSGAMVTGWQYIGGKWYYMNSSGAMVTGWQRIDGVQYYFDASGAMR